MAPASDSTSPSAPQAYQQSPPPPDQGSGSYAQQPPPPPPAGQPSYSDQSYNQAPDDSDYSDYGEQPVAYAPQPPPPLPDYDQPPDPGDDYLWTPGYWAYAPVGYYWVPGAWVEAPYQGALWTPGYWGYAHNRYCFFRGYWGPHIGFYGGVNYGFGYVGVGYLGGYWGGGHFHYNRTVNNVNVNVVHNVYNYRINQTTIINNRVSYNGGSGGIQARPRPQELAALREPHAAPMQAQVQNEHTAAADRSQFANVNHGRPASVAVNRPLAADRNVHPVAPPQARMQPGPNRPMQPENPQPPQARTRARPESPHATAGP